MYSQYLIFVLFIFTQFKFDTICLYDVDAYFRSPHFPVINTRSLSGDVGSVQSESDSTYEDEVQGEIDWHVCQCLWSLLRAGCFCFGSILE